jgi:hypothetical protein
MDAGPTISKNNKWRSSLLSLEEITKKGPWKRKNIMT